ncbi:MAG: hypothetical protein RXQ22_07655 [Sulfolobus sp.]
MQQKVTIKVSESTLKILKKLKEENNSSSIDDTIFNKNISMRTWE